MCRRLLFFSLIGFCSNVEITLAEDSSSPAKQKPEWFICEASSDCRLVEADCGRHNAVNKKYGDSYSKWLDAAVDRSNCVLPALEKTSTPLQAESELKVSCREGQCIVQQRGEQGGS